MSTAARRPPSHQKSAPFLLVLGVSLAAYTLLVATHAWVGDDCFISFRYAHNLARGLGLRYNVGVEPPVEGYSELAWVLWMSICELLGQDPRAWAQVSGYGAGLSLLVSVAWFAWRRMGLSALPTAVAALFFATAPTVVLWTTGGMGTMWFALAVFATCERLLGDPERPRGGQAAALALCALLLRADGFYWLALVLAVAAGHALLVRQPRLLRHTLACAAVLAVAFGAHTLWRLSYYGDFLPNTARAKVAMSAAYLERGWFYLVHYWLTVPGALLAFAVGVAVACRRGEAWTRCGTAVAAGTFLYGVLASGDFMPMGRFFLPAFPFLALAVGRGVHLLRARGLHAASWLLIAVLAVGSIPPLFDVHCTPRAWRESFRVRQQGEYRSEHQFWAYEVENARRWSDEGRALARFAERGSSLVRGPIGAVGYYSDLFIYDVAGLVNREVVEQVPPKPKATPGHDRAADLEFFAKYDPTYARSLLVYDSEGEERIRRIVEAAKSGALEAYRFERADGFREDGYLVLHRFRKQ
jgi:hypothetical protein